MHPQAALIGHLVGALIAMVLLSWLLEWGITSRLSNDPVRGKLSSVVAACVIATVIYCLNEPWRAVWAFSYVVAAIPVAIWKYRAGLKARERAELRLEDTFS